MSMSDVPFIIALIFGFAVTSFFVLFIINYLGTQPPFTLNNVSASIMNATATGYSYTDTFIPAAFLIFALISIVLAYTVNVPSFFVFLGFFVMLVIPLASGSLANMFFEIQTVMSVYPAAPAFPVTTTFFQNLPLFSTVLGVLIMIATYGKGRTSTASF